MKSNTMAIPDLITAWNDGPIKHHDSECRDNLQKRLLELKDSRASQATIFVGAGTCGLGAGAGKTLNALRKMIAEKQLDAQIVEVGCIGLCAVEPMVDVALPGRARISFQEVTGDKVPALIEAVFAEKLPEGIEVLGQHLDATSTPWEGVRDINEHPFFAPQTRWVLANCGVIDPARIEEYVTCGGYSALAYAITHMTPEEVRMQVQASGLRGRGGGGFPTGVKWKFAQDQRADQKYLVCNADEGDPGAFMDRAVIEGDPHRLLEGMALAAYAIGATKAYVYIRAEYPLAIERLKVAIAQAREFGLLGRNILDSGLNLDIIIKMGAGAFVCGEETALIHSIEGKRGMPRPRPPFPAVAGLFGKPTVINNVETLSNLPGIIARGSEWFSAVGTEGSKGTKVFALSGKVSLTGLVEVTMGTTVRDVVFAIGGGVPNGKTFKAVQIGGPSGGCIPTQHLDIEIDYESLKTVGAMMGSGGLVVMDEDTCMVDVAKFFMDFIQRESCGKCIPCREGTRRLLETLRRITTKPRGRSEDHDALARFRSMMYLNRLATTIQDASLCGLGQTAPNPILSTLRFFRDEYEAHVYERRCPAGVCQDLVTYAIDAEKCIGCTACVKKCPTGAIMGAVKSPHYIVADKCIACGACMAACKFGAVIKE